MNGGIFCHMNIIEFYDHMVPLSFILNVPIYVSDDPISMSLCEEYYPQVDIREHSLKESTPQYFAVNYDYMIFPSHVKREEEHLLAESEKHGKKLCIMFCPHGFSDKTYYWLEYTKKDYVFVYGQNMLDIFHEIGISLDPQRCIMVGNYRYEFFKEHREHQISIVKNEFFQGVDMSLKTLFYAPTWVDDGNSSTFFEGIKSIIEKLPKDFNLIVKPHPRILVCFPSEYYEVLSHYAQHDRVVFIDEFPMIYPILDLCDYYLGDMSSIGYDFLSFNKPMFFINKSREGKFLERQQYLYRCGTTVDLSDIDQLYEIILQTVPVDEERYSKVRKEVYDYTFGQPISNEAIKGDFEKKLSQYFN